MISYETFALVSDVITAHALPQIAMKGISREDAYLLASVAMDLRVTQVVDGAKGVHAVIAKSIFAR